MDTRTFYGGNNVQIPKTDDSNDENLSSDDDHRKNELMFLTKPIILCESSDSESSVSTTEAIIIDETDSEDDSDNIPLSIIRQSLLQRSEHTKNNEFDINIPSTSAGIPKKLTARRKKVTKDKINWEEKHLAVSEDFVQFKGSETLPDNINGFEDPFQFFNFLFTDEIFDYIIAQSNLYGVQIRPEKPPNISKEELRVFCGICLYMSIIQLPSTRSYWNQSLEIPNISGAMTCNRFEEIKRFMHFNDNTVQIPYGQPGHDKLFKIRPFLNKIRERLLRVPKEEHMAVDEQIIPTKARSSLKMYNPQKPHKWGYKVFVLSGISGFSYDFDFYCGPTTLGEDQLDLGASSNVVIKLAETIPKNLNYKLFFDNWFTSIPLLTYLTKHGILPLGTVRANRVPDFQFPKESDMKKKGRGAVLEKVANVDDVDISAVSWYDNKIVNTISTYVGSQPTSKVRRFCKKTKSYIEISRPQSIAVYNSYMGGVDLLDSMLGYYRIQIRSKKWYMRVFFHFLDMTCVNSWLLWRRNLKDTDLFLPLSEFKLALAEILTRSNNSLQRKRGRPSTSLQPVLDLKKRKYPFSQIPAQEIRTDNLNHLPIVNEERQRCKYPECKGKSQISCRKCRVFLCLNKDRNCFYKFHTE